MPSVPLHFRSLFFENWLQAADADAAKHRDAYFKAKREADTLHTVSFRLLS